MGQDSNQQAVSQAWETFSHSGKINDYLAYHTILEGAENGTNQNKGNRHSGNEVRGIR